MSPTIGGRHRAIAADTEGVSEGRRALLVQLAASSFTGTPDGIVVEKNE
jgi:hypothetical protein